MKFAKSIATSFLSNMFGLFVSFLTIVVTARILGPGGNGIFNFGMVFIGTAGIVFGFGIQASNVYFIGRDRKDINPILGVNFLIMLLAFIGMFFVYLLQLKFHFSFIRVLSGRSLILVMLTVPFYIIKTSLYYVLLGIEEVTKYNKMTMLDKACTFLLLFVFIFIFRSAELLIISNFIATCLMVAIICYILFVQKRYGISFDKAIFKNMMKYGIKSQLGNAIQNINYRLDVFVTGAYLNTAAVGLYTKASTLGETMWRVSGSVGIVVLPYTANSKDTSQRTLFINKVIRVTFAFILICAIALTLICKPLIILVLSKKFAGSVMPFKLIIPGISIFAINNILNSYFAGSGMVGKNIIASGIAAVITVILDFTLIPIYGINGAAITSSISYTVCTIVSLYFYTKHTGSNLFDVLILKKSDLIEIKSKLLTLKKRKSA